MINYKSLNIPDVVLIEPQVFDDERGYFFEPYNKKKFNDEVFLKDIEFVQDNFSFSKQNVIRGLHYQTAPFEQGKLVRVTYGSVFDVAVDIRKNSPTFGKWVGEILSFDNKKMLWIPPGFAHGFQVLSEEVNFEYKVTNYWNKKSEKTLLWNDPDIGIKWKSMTNIPIISLNDRNGKNICDI